MAWLRTDSNQSAQTGHSYNLRVFVFNSLYILVDSFIVKCWMSPFVTLGMLFFFVLFFFAFILFLMKNPVSKQCRP